MFLQMQNENEMIQGMGIYRGGCRERVGKCLGYGFDNRVE